MTSETLVTWYDLCFLSLPSVTRSYVDDYEKEQDNDDIDDEDDYEKEEEKW